MWFALLTARGTALVLAATGALHLFDYPLFARWFATQFGVDGTTALAVGVAVGIVEMGLGFLGAVAPRRLAASMALVWSVFGAYHAVALVLPSLGSCPCLGRLGAALDSTVLHVVLLLLCGTGAGASLLCGSGHPRPRTAALSSEASL